MGHKHRIQRCTANESLSITSTAAIVGRVIDAATLAGANSIDGPNFSFANPSAGEVAAERAAITDARNQATAAADRLGYTVTGVKSISLNPQSGGVSSSGSGCSPVRRGHRRHQRRSTWPPVIGAWSCRPNVSIGFVRRWRLGCFGAQWSAGWVVGRFGGSLAPAEAR
jgi:hypothetical protein